MHGGHGLPSIEVLLTQRSERPTVDGHRPHVHLGLGGLGLFIVNALSERFELATVRDGVEARTMYARGVLIEPLTTVATSRPSGTWIRFRPDPQIFRFPRVPRAPLAQRLEDLPFLLPQMPEAARCGAAFGHAGIEGCEATRTAGARRPSIRIRMPVLVPSEVLRSTWRTGPVSSSVMR